MMRTRGFTLLEVLVATAILGLAVVSLMGTQSGALKLAAAQQREILTGELAQQLLAEAIATSFEDLQNTSGKGEGQYARYTWTRTLHPTGQARLTRVSISVRNLDDKEVTSVETYVTAPEVDL